MSGNEEGKSTKSDNPTQAAPVTVSTKSMETHLCFSDRFVYENQWSIDLLLFTLYTYIKQEQSNVHVYHHDWAAMQVDFALTLLFLFYGFVSLTRIS